MDVMFCEGPELVLTEEQIQAKTFKEVLFSAQGFFLFVDGCPVGERKYLLYLMAHWFVTETILGEWLLPKSVCSKIDEEARLLGRGRFDLIKQPRALSARAQGALDNRVKKYGKRPEYFYLEPSAQVISDYFVAEDGRTLAAIARRGHDIRMAFVKYLYETSYVEGDSERAEGLKPPSTFVAFEEQAKHWIARDLAVFGGPEESLGLGVERIH